MIMLPLFTSAYNVGTKMISVEGSPQLSGSIEAIEVMDSSNLAADQEFLIGYVNYMRMYAAGSRVSFMEFMHLTVCVDFPCYCEVYFALASHYDNCHVFECKLCRPARRSCVTVKHPQGSRILEAGRPTEEILPPAKLPIMRNTSSSIIGVSDVAASSKTQPLGPEQLPHVQQWPEASQPQPKMAFGIWRAISKPPRESKKRDGSHAPTETPPPSKRLKMGNPSFCGVGDSDVAGSSTVQPHGHEQLPCLQQWPEASALKDVCDVAVSTPTPGCTSSASSGSVGTEVELKSELDSNILTHKECTDNVKKIVSDLFQLLDYPSANILGYDHEEEERDVGTMSDQAKVEIRSDLLDGGADSKIEVGGAKARELTEPKMDFGIWRAISKPPRESKKRDGSHAPKEIPPPSKRLKTGNPSFCGVGDSDVAGSSTVQPHGHEQLPCLQQWPEASALKDVCDVAVTPGCTSSASSGSVGTEVELKSELDSNILTHKECTDNVKKIVSDLFQLLDYPSANILGYDHEEEERDVGTMSDQAKVEISSDLLDGGADSKIEVGGAKARELTEPKMAFGIWRDISKPPRESKKREGSHAPKEIPPPSKRLKMGNPSFCGVGASDVAASSKTQPLGPEQLPHVQQWPETSAPNFTSTEVAFGIWRDISKPPRESKKREGSHAPTEIPPPSKRLKTGNPSFCGVGASDVAGSSTVQPHGHEQLPCLQQWPEASASKEVCAVAVSTPTPGCTSSASSGSVGTEVELKSELESNIPTHKEEQKTVPEEGADNVKKIISDLIQLLDYPSANILGYDHEEEETMSDQAKVEIKSDLLDGGADSKMRLGGPKLAGVSLVDFFTLEETEEHLFSLKQPIVQGLDGNTLANNVAENSCQLCAKNKLVYRTVTFCSSCNKHIKHGKKIHCGLDERGMRLCFCNSCFVGSRGPTISFQGSSIPKANLQKMKNDHEDDESWVQCDKCRLWQHQVCALYISKRDFEGKAAYLCPKCHSQGIKNGEHVPLPKTASFGAKDLPTSLLSDYIEQRLFRRLRQDREKRAKALRKNIDEVPGAVDLVVRVVLSADKLLKVDQHFLDVCSHENYPTEFPYRSKMLLLFQKIEGVDVCLFALYVQEFGSECGHPNQRSVYISYLDSVKYFRPEIKAASGEALRTFVYHEILIGYLDYCKKRGFAACYIWACPPSKGDDYILSGHPETQKIPKSDKLRQWYKSMLGKAAKENIVVDCTNLYDHLFAPTGECNVKITAARMPYFDGDRWSAAAVNKSKSFQQESQVGLEKKVKKVLSKRAFRAMGHSKISTDATKDILLMQELGQAMLNVKQDFLVAHLQFTCTRCREVILAGARWNCPECKNFQLCARCHDAKQDCNEESTHTSSSGKKHHLFQVAVADHIPVDTEDGDAILEDKYFEDRRSFVKFCEENHYVFDTLRRAKHTSMMMLYDLQARNDSEEKELITS